MDGSLYAHVFFQFLLGTLSIIGFCLVINIPRRSILAASVIAGAGWATYIYLVSTGSDKATAAFAGAALIGLVSELASRYYREAATVFIIPAILPLVPGAGMYYAMLALVGGDYITAGEEAAETLLMAGSIALALLAMSSVTRLAINLKRYLSYIRHEK